MPPAGSRVRESLEGVLDYRRTALFGEAAEIDLYKVNGTSWVFVRTLTEGFCPRKIRVAAGGFGWMLDIWCLGWDDIKHISAARLRAKEQTLTFKLTALGREMIDGQRLRIPMVMIGDQP